LILISNATMCEEDVLSISRKIERVVNGQKSDDNAVDMLRKLKSLPITLEILQRTRIGMTVNELRKKSERKDVQSEAKNLIKAWKKLLEGKDAKSDKVGLPRNDSFASNISDSLDATDIGGGSSNGDSYGRKGATGTDKPKPKPAPVASSSRQTSSSSSGGGDDYRNSSRQLILKSLQGEPLDGTLDPEALAIRIEQCIYDQFKSTNDKYKAAIRSRVFNLRDKRNPELRENVLLGMVSPERLATMSTEEMASKEMKQLRTTLTKQAINDYQMATDSGTPTDMFKCGRCQKKNCTYTQAQTRSADEPMTTFVYCRECGYRWKFC